MSSPGSQTPTVSSLKIEPFRGGNQLMVGGGIAGVVLLVLALVGGGMSSPKETFYSYLVAFAYWCGIAFASLLLLMIFHATHARWMTILRRPVEAMASAMWIFIFLVIPIWIGMKEIFTWVDPVGVKFDAAIYDDDHEDESWDGIWDVATTIDSLGWTAEFRIPLSQLRYPIQATHVFGLAVTRDIERYKERIAWPVFRRSKARSATSNPGRRV